MLRLETLDGAFTVCQVADAREIDLGQRYCFVGKTDGELSLLCETARTPDHTLRREDGWRGFRVRGTLDFSLTGVLARLSGVLAAQGIPLFAVSTYNTDYIFVKAGELDRALAALEQAEASDDAGLH